MLNSGIIYTKPFVYIDNMLKDYIQLIRADKPIGTLLLLWPTLIALFVASHGIPPFYCLVVFSLGVFLTRSAGCAINDVFDADFDKHVKRTENRPITSGKISKLQGVLVCIGLSLIAYVLAICYLNSITLYCCIPAVVIFITYPLMKRILPVPQAYLGLAFSFGILMAFIEIKGSLNFTAWICFIANLFWVIGYDTIYALEDMADDAKIGIKTSALTFGKYAVRIIAICYFLFIVLFIVLGFILQLNIFYYLILLIAAILLVYQIAVIYYQKRYLPMFLLNNWVGITVFIGIAVGVY